MTLSCFWQVSLLVLDEADRLLDLGFEADLRMALSLLRPPPPPSQRHAPPPPPLSPPPPPPPPPPLRTLLFSATFSAPIRALAAELLEPSALRVTVERASAVAARGAHLGAQPAAASPACGAADADLTSSASVLQRFEIYRGKGARGAARRRLLVLLRTHLGEEIVADHGRSHLGEESGDEGDEAESGESGESEAEEEETEEEEVEEEEEAAEAEAAEAEAAAAAEAAEAEAAEAVGDDKERRSVGSDGVAAAVDISDEAEDEAGSATEERPRVIVFATYKLEARQLTEILISRGLPAVALHGDMAQRARGEAMAAFRTGAARVLVATDVAARGLDVRHVSAVINTSLGVSLENYVHRVGRCGRAGATGVATTFLVDGDEALTPPLVALLERSRQRVPPEVAELARKAEAEAARVASGPSRRAGLDGEDEEEDERTQAQTANREKQMARHRAHKSKELKGR